MTLKAVSFAREKTPAAIEFVAGVVPLRGPDPADGRSGQCAAKPARSASRESTRAQMSRSGFAVVRTLAKLVQL
jgi:hypothetical protein